MTDEVVRLLVTVAHVPTVAEEDGAATGPGGSFHCWSSDLTPASFMHGVSVRHVTSGWGFCGDQDQLPAFFKVNSSGRHFENRRRTFSSVPEMNKSDDGYGNVPVMVNTKRQRNDV